MPNLVSPDNYNQFTDLTTEVQLIPNQWGRINRMGLFEAEGITQTSVTFDLVEDTLTLLDSSNRYARKGTVGQNESVKTLAFPISFFEHEDRVTAADLQGRRRPGSTDQVDQRTVAVAKKLAKMRLQHDITREFMSMSALKGQVVSPNGIIYADLYASYGLTEKVIDFELGTATTDIDGKISELRRHIEDNALTGELAGNIKVLVSRTFFDKLTSHPNIREAYLFYRNENQANSAQVNRDSFVTGSYNNASVEEFTHKGVSFEVYATNYKKANGDSIQLIADDEGHAFPLSGMGSEMYKNYLAPADKLGYENTIGELVYAWEYEDTRGNGIDLESQSAILPLVRKPGALCKVITSN